jgi:hypothetical protein
MFSYFVASNNINRVYSYRIIWFNLVILKFLSLKTHILFHIADKPLKLHSVNSNMLFYTVKFKKITLKSECIFLAH